MKGYYEELVENQAKRIKERNGYIRAGKYSCVDGGCVTFGEILVAGENHKEAGAELERRINGTRNVTRGFEIRKEIEDKYNVIVESGWQIDIEKIINN